MSGTGALLLILVLAWIPYIKSDNERQSGDQELLTIHGCTVTRYSAIYRPVDNLFQDDPEFKVGTFKRCVEMCLTEYGCVAVNYAVRSGYCTLHHAGYNPEISDEFLDDVSADQNYDHATIKCPSVEPPSTSVGCGIQDPSHMPAFHVNSQTGAINAKPYSWPWLAKLIIGFKTTCGSILLRVKTNNEMSDILVTPARCVTLEETQSTEPQVYNVNQAVVRVIAGKNRDSVRYEKGQQGRRVAQIRVHPDFRYSPQEGAINDIAVVKLEAPIVFSKTIRPICLPAQGEETPTGNQCVQAGWASDDYGPTPASVQQLAASVNNMEMCKSAWAINETHNIYEGKDTICVGSMPADSDLCLAELGGSLACENNGQWTLHGTTSFGFDNECMETGLPPIFTRITSYIDWIKENMAEMSGL